MQNVVAGVSQALGLVDTLLGGMCDIPFAAFLALAPAGKKSFTT